MTEDKKKQPSILYLGIFLGIIGAISAGLLAEVALMTKKPIEQAQLKKTNAALKAVLPAFDNEPAKEKQTIKAADGTEVTFYIAKSAGKIVGVAGEGYSMKGFAGKVTVMAGMDVSGKIRTVIVTEQHETPGLGTVITDRKSEKTIYDLFGDKKKKQGLPPNPILDKFDGHTAVKNGKPWAVKKDGGEFDFVTGATITSRAVTAAVYKVALTYTENRDKIAPIPEEKK